MPVGVILAGGAILLGAAMAGAAAPRSRVVGQAIYLGCLLVCAATAALAGKYLLAPSNPAPRLILPVGLPQIGAHFRLDTLAALFLAIINLGGAAASLFAMGYGRHERSPGRVLPFFPAFLAGMNVVILADDAFTFLFAWEFMSLASWALVMAHHQEAENRRAGYIYLVMAGFGTLTLLLAFGLLAGADGRYAFADMAAATPAPWLSSLVLVLVLLGAGSKAGLVPLHVWLPLAHPAAPSHVSALMSGVMTKVAIYAFVRVAFNLVGSPAWWWSILVLAIGAATAVLGVLSALLQADLKRLLACSTIENVGIIFIGLGLALAFKANGMPGPAALALTAALLHAVNHSLFKSLLFFGAGAVLSATATRNIEKLGGLIHRMPVTAFMFLGGCLAIAALPPLNGFVSEWLVFQAVLTSPDLPQWSLKLLVPAVGAMLALSAALSAACFVRAFAVTFLGRARSSAVEGAAETEKLSLAAMGVLLALCVLIGIVPGALIDALAPVVEPLVGQSMPPQGDIAWASIVPIAESRSSYNGLLMLAFITLSTLLGIEIIHRFASRALRRAPAWDCGYPDPDPATQYTADSFTQPIRRVFGPFVFAASERVDMPHPGDARPARLTVSLRDIVWDTVYAPIEGWVATAAEKLNHLQFLTIRKYLSLVFFALVTLLLVLSLWF
jgi:formate hydrogenlyase subunit 3/multisubunit Na+/H+ antiporter MnhD subunit